MRSKVLMAVILATLGSLLFTTGCSCLFHSDMPYGPKVTGDGTGGAIAVYEEIRSGGHDFYAQKIGPDGKALWGDKGVLLGSSYSQFYSFFSLHIMSDGSGGAIIAWLELSSRETYISHVSKVDSEGRILWQKDFEHVDQLISDGAGRAIIAFDYIGDVGDERNLLVTRIDSQGNFPWGPGGVVVPRKKYQDNTLQLASDGAGGAVIVWEELESQPEPEPHSPKITERIFAQRIDSKGSLSWGQDGVLLYTTPEDVYCDEPCLVGDGSGGAIIAWHQWPRGRIEGGTPKSLLVDIYTQRIDTSGNILWQPNGVRLEIVKAAEGASPHTPRLASDGSGGAITIWEDLRQGLASVYAQRIDAGGNIRWQPGGLQVCYIKSNSSLVFRQIAGDGLGGAIVSSRFKEAGMNKKGVLVQKLDATGKTVWPGNGIVVTDSDTNSHFISSDGQGGALVSWGIGKGMFNSEKSHIQRVDANGRLLWGAEGIRLSP